MMIKLNQRGYVIKIVLIVFSILIGLMIFPVRFPALIDNNDDEGPEEYCRDLIDDPNAPIVEAPAYTATEVQPNNLRQYRLIKANVPIYRAFFVDESHEHFFNSYKEPYTDPETGQKYVIRIPKGEQGKSYIVPSELGENYLQFADYGLVYLFYTSNGVDPEVIDEVDLGPGATSGTNGILDIVQADIYKAVDLPPLPEWVLKCNDLGLSPEGVPSQSLGGVVFPRQEKSLTKDQLQLEWFLFNKHDFQIRAWWVPHCKPAVYLYPERRQLVNVKVFPKGELSYTDPVYDPVKGWNVEAYPDGKLLSAFSSQTSARQYDYLYYESKLLDSEIKKPEVGWSVKKGEMEELLNRVLPELGLNAKEQKDFMDYWLGKLPESPYYFVGLVEKDRRDYLEALAVTPEPDTSIRFSLFFEPAEEFQVVKEPVIVTPKRDGFTLVDWGGMIKLHPETPFTCSQ